MHYHMDSDIVDAVTWLASEFTQFMDDPFLEEEQIDPIVTINKTSSEFIPSWNSVELKKDEIPLATNVPKILTNESINSRIFVGSCDILSLEVDAVTIFLEESNKYRSKLARRVIIQSNRLIDYDQVLKLRCGESLMVRVYNIGATNVIFSMITRYSSKYYEASTNILNMTIRDTLKAAIEKNVEVVAYPVSVDEDVFYPNHQYLDTLLRTLRRWLELPEIRSKIKKIYLILHVPGSYDDSTVSSVGSTNCMQIMGTNRDTNKELFNLLRRYFPRNKYEELLSGDLATIGNINGELTSEERNIKISEGFNSYCSKPIINLAESMRVSNDSDRDEDDVQYSYYLKLSYSISKLPIYQEFMKSRFVSRCGNDKENRPIIAINARNYTFSEHDYAISYVLGTIKPYIQHKFVIVVLHLDYSMINSTTLLKLLRDLCQIFGHKRTKNIAAIYFHRCSWALRSYLFLISTFLPAEVWDATVFVDSFKDIAHLGLDPSNL